MLLSRFQLSRQHAPGSLPTVMLWLASNCHALARSQTQAFRTHSQAAWCPGTNLRVYRTALHAGVNYNRGSTSGRGPYTGGGQRHWRLKKKKTTETEAHSQLVTAYACTVPGCGFPAKFGCQPIKLELYLPRTRIPPITCACNSGISGYIKGVE